MRGNTWKSADDRDRQVRLLRYIARRLSQPATFVLFHIDGDRPWSQHEDCENIRKFHRLILDRLPQVAVAGRAHTAALRDTSPVAPPQPKLAHLLLLCPFYSIEAWLYQNFPAATALCQDAHGYAHRQCWEAWHAQPAVIEELSQPKLVCCLAAKYNLVLASRQFPAEQLYYRDQSFTKSVNRLMNCEALCAALAQTTC